MKYLVISDIHSNLESFEKLLNIKKVKEVDKILFLGDLVGYGANPNEVIELFRSLKKLRMRYDYFNSFFLNLRLSFFVSI